MGFFAGRRVVVAGASGLLGVHFVEALLAQGAQVRAVVHRRPLPSFPGPVEVVTGDLTRADDCTRAAAGMDIAVLAAAVVVGAKAQLKNPALPVTENLIIGARFLETAAGAGIDRLLLLSSTTTYPAVDYPVREEEWDRPPADVYQGVAHMKRYLETLARFYYDKFGLKVAILRPVPCYGPWDNFDPESSHVIPGLIRKAVGGMRPFEVWGTGKEVRDFVHGADVARAGLLALEKHAVCDAFNVGSGRPVTIGELATIILGLTGRSGEEPVFDATQPSTIPVRVVDTAKIERVLGFCPRVTLEDGLAATIDWFRRVGWPPAMRAGEWGERR